ncbi:DnaA N-terminal domain-containing protein [Aliiruegeria lutimaris]|uniref:DnaA N-terminal domain-containing protein n=2 Tax=Aliiruegeria lutimaris TaxID=571298 RepID=A0A1G9MZC4_9RHOB|nr:DnaA N-terminal domain-containing protein [Aliiruegeria lutimaris]
MPAAGKVLPFPGNATATPPDLSSGDEWALASGLLFSMNPSLHASWLAPLKREKRVGDRLLLHAPTRFHATYVQTHLLDQILAALHRVDDSVGLVTVMHG